MSNRTDVELLSQYRAGSQPAFAELVKRHVDWVYSAARRQVRDAHLAEDVTQAVFIALAGNWRLTENTVVSNWLFGVVRYTSSNAIRDRIRRHRNEAAAASEREPNRELPEEWNELSPLLEDAVARLRPEDREAVLLRFYQRFTSPKWGKRLEFPKTARASASTGPSANFIDISRRAALLFPPPFWREECSSIACRPRRRHWLRRSLRDHRRMSD